MSTPSKSELTKLTVPKLKDLSTDLSISKEGKKSDLINRILAASANATRVASRSKSPKSRVRSKTPVAKKATPKKTPSKSPSKTPSRSKSPAPKSPAPKSPAKSAKKATPAKATPKKTPTRSKSPAPKRTPVRSMSPAPKSEEESAQAAPMYSLFVEPKGSAGKFLTESGANNIRVHKYVGGSYTTLDNLLNPFWTQCTEWLPMWMAPNAVTTLGGSFCLMAYLLTYYHCPTWGTPAPAFVLVVNGACTFIYYTLDCMDGKQARRVGASSPLGQLFDHGVDCLGNLAHYSTVAAIIAPGVSTHFTIMGQGLLQLSFFIAQWQEYHTRTLPHKFGEFGVTEVNMVVSAVSCGAAMVSDLEAVMATVWWLPILGEMEFRFVVIVGWILMNFVLISISFSSTLGGERGFAPLQHLFTPTLLTASLMFLPSSTLLANTRAVSLAFGFCICFLTVKMIVFSMAKMTFATVQKDAFVVLAAVGVSVYGEGVGLTVYGEGVVWWGVAAWCAARFFYWVRGAIQQLCEKLDIYCFSIKRKVA